MLEESDKKLLSAALWRDRRNEPMTFAWGKQLEESEVVTLKDGFFQIVNLPSWTFTIPVSRWEFSQLLQASDPVVSTENEDNSWIVGVREINRFKILLNNELVYSTMQNLMELALFSLLSFKTDLSSVEAHWDKLLLVQTGGYWKPQCDSEEIPGMFGTMFLQIPLSSGHRGGRIKVSHRGKSKTFDGIQENGQRFHLTACYADCHHELEPLTEGSMLILVLRLVWKGAVAAADSPLDLPIFLSALHVARPLLTSWAGEERQSSAATNSPKLPEVIPHEPLVTPKSAPLQIESSKLSAPVSEENSVLRRTLLMPREGSTTKGRENNPNSPTIPSSGIPASGSDCIQSATMAMDEEPQVSKPTMAPDSPESPRSNAATSTTDTLGGSSSSDCSEEYDEAQEELRLSKRIRQKPIKNALPLPMDSLLFLPLERTYSTGELRFSALRGRDRLVATILQQVDSIKCDLANVICSVAENDCCGTELDEDCDCPFEVTLKVRNITGFDYVPIEVRNDHSIPLDIRSQLIGNVGDFIFRPDEGLNTVRTVLIIWPRRGDSGSVLFRCFHAFDTLLEGMELMPACAPGLLEDLRQMVAFCQSYPLEVWNGHPRKDGERSRRLLRLCIQLSAKKEGLELLRLMGEDWGPESTAKAMMNPHWMNQKLDVFYIGVGSKNAEIMAEFVSRISGWTDCAELILRLITPVRLPYQWCYFISLVRHLKYRQCISGALETTARISSAVLSWLQGDISKEGVRASAILNGYADLVLTLETDQRTSDPTRISDLVKLLPGLDANRMCDLAIHLHQLGRMSLPCSRKLFSALFRSLLTCDLGPLFFRETKILFKLLDAFEHFDGCLLTTFVGRICATGPLLGKILLHLRALRLDQTIMKTLMAARIESLKTATEEKECGRGLTVCFRLCLRMEMDEELSDALKALFFQLPAERQCQLLVDLWKSEGERMVKKRPASLFLFRQLCKIFSACPSAELSLPSAVVTFVLEFLDQLGDVNLIASAAKKLSSQGEPGEKTELSPWNPARNDLIEKAITSYNPDTLDLSTFSSLLFAWVGGFCCNPDLEAESSSIADPITRKILNYIHLAFRVEEEKMKAQLTSEPESLANCFNPLFVRLSDRRLSHLVLDICRAYGPSSRMSESPPCWNAYRQLCRTFANRDLTLLVRQYEQDRSVSVVLDLMKCFIWLDDAQALTNFACHITAACPAPHTNESFWDVVTYISKENLTSRSGNVRTAMTALIDERSFQIQAALDQLPASLEQPDAHVPGHPDVEDFLRSPRDWMTYDHSTDFNLAAHFALRLIRERAKSGYLIRTTTYRSGPRVTVSIQKFNVPALNPAADWGDENRKFDLLLPHQLRHELGELKTMRQKHCRQPKPLLPQTAEEASKAYETLQEEESKVTESSPPLAKRIKMDDERVSQEVGELIEEW